MSLRISSLGRGLAFIGVLVAVLFGTAGRWDLPFFWAYIAVTAAVTLVAVFTVDPALQMERWNPAVRAADFWLMAVVIVPCWGLVMVIAGLDAGRYHWSDRVSCPLQSISLVVYAVSAAGAVWATAVNRFFSPVVRIQTERGHRL